MSVCVCVCLCLGGRWQLATRGYGEAWEQLSALWSANYWISLLGSWGNGRFDPNPSREVTGGHGSKFLPFGDPSAPIEFLFAGIIGKRPFWAKSWPGGHGRSGRSWEVTGGYGRLRAVTEGENGGKWRNGRIYIGWKKTKENEGKSWKAGGKWRKMEELRSSTESSVRWGSEQDSLQGDEEWYWGRGGEGLQSTCCRWFGLLI